jgi:hypothetical protein
MVLVRALGIAVQRPHHRRQGSNVDAGEVSVEFIGAGFAIAIDGSRPSRWPWS